MHDHILQSNVPLHRNNHTVPHLSYIYIYMYIYIYIYIYIYTSDFQIVDFPTHIERYTIPLVLTKSQTNNDNISCQRCLFRPFVCWFQPHTPQSECQ